MGANDAQAIFLPDEPVAENSAFEIHNVIADAIVDEINSGAPCNIAILGEWGSGKSTVLKHIEHKLGKDSIFFVFDAWSHSGDSLRKSFIESLSQSIPAQAHKTNKANETQASNAHSLHEVDYIANTDAREIVRGMDRSVTASESSEDVSLKPVPISLLIGTGVFAFLSIVLNACAPFVKRAAVFLGFLASDVNLGLTQFIPLFSVVCAFVAGTFIYKKVKEQNVADAEGKGKQGKRFQELINELANFFAKKTVGTMSVTKTEYSSVLDSREFENLFKRLLRLTDKKIVIAFDNLDRLEGDELASAWSTLQVFSEVNREANYEHKLWILLPITRSIFAELEGLNKEKGIRPQHKPISLSKLFIRSFEIPTPISTDWKNYFFLQAREAFPLIDDKTLSQVYSIASHSLLKVELRTPRNAKRFLNSMVSISRVFPGVNLESVAAYCYLRDAYNISKQQLSFNEYMIDVINGSADTSFYLSSVEQQNAKLKNELAMIAFGQFSSEKASEVFVYSMFRNVVTHGKEMSVSKLVKGNPGVWEMLTRLVEDELLETYKEETPRWIYILLDQLNVGKYSYDASEIVELKTLARVLLSGVKSIDAGSFNGLGEVVAQNLLSCESGIVDRISKAAIAELQKSRELADTDSRFEDRKAILKKYICELSPIFQVLYEDSFSTSLGKSLRSIYFGHYYSFLLEGASSYCCSGNGEVWLIERPPVSTEEVGSLLNLLKSMMSEEPMNEAPIVITKESRLLATCTLEKKEAKRVKDILKIDQDNEGEWESFLWILEELYDIESPFIHSLFYEIPFEIENYSYLSKETATAHKLAFSCMVLQHVDKLDEGNQPNRIVMRAFDDDCIQFGKDNNFDLFPFILSKIEEDGSKKTAEWMLERYWSNEEVEKREIQECFEYANHVKAQDCRSLGVEIALARRVDDLMALPFELRHIEIYLGVIEGCENNMAYNKWVVSRLESVEKEQWDEYLATPCMNTVVSLLNKACSVKTEFASLDRAIAKRIKSGESCYKVEDVFDAYRPNFELFNEAFSSRFFENKVAWQSLIRLYGDIMKRTSWLEQISAKRRWQAIETIIKANRGYGAKWLAEYLDPRERIDPKSLFNGHIRDAKKMLRNNIGLKSYNESYKNAAKAIIMILS